MHVALLRFSPLAEWRSTPLRKGRRVKLLWSLDTLERWTWRCLVCLRESAWRLRGGRAAGEVWAPNAILQRSDLSAINYPI